jgi:hypothetical protein
MKALYSVFFPEILYYNEGVKIYRGQFSLKSPVAGRFPKELREGATHVLDQIWNSAG